MTDQPPPYYAEKTGPYPPQPQAAYPPPQQVKSSPSYFVISCRKLLAWAMHGTSCGHYTFRRGAFAFLF
ncbi:hypothetical protein GBAR_LOCUS9088 [Geodia barretti]|uniref:Uncharacterized protein n=1 Tax=Geodia barretti TaxID=519541 RepID=A0AA35RNY5_GEOBA|nr:hypothetical protein GBAR_LOCUS9088 [Geodia barretti]